MLDICYINRPKLVEIARLCFQNDYYHAGIFVPNERTFKNVVDDLLQITYLPNFRLVRRNTKTNYCRGHPVSAAQAASCDFLFNNGSSITVAIPGDGCRGHRMHALVADPDIDSYTLDTVIRPYEIEYIK